jgi:hypothetical protein
LYEVGIVSIEKFPTFIDFLSDYGKV